MDFGWMLKQRFLFYFWTSWTTLKQRCLFINFVDIRWMLKQRWLFFNFVNIRWVLKQRCLFIFEAYGHQMDMKTMLCLFNFEHYERQKDLKRRKCLLGNFVKEKTRKNIVYTLCSLFCTIGILLFVQMFKNIF